MSISALQGYPPNLWVSLSWLLLMCLFWGLLLWSQHPHTESVLWVLWVYSKSKWWLSKKQTNTQQKKHCKKATRTRNKQQKRNRKTIKKHRISNDNLQHKLSNEKKQNMNKQKQTLHNNKKHSHKKHIKKQNHNPNKKSENTTTHVWMWIVSGFIFLLFECIA